MEQPRITKIILTKNNMLGGLTQSNDKGYYIAILTMVVFYWWRKTEKTKELDGKPTNQFSSIQSLSRV